MSDPSPGDPPRPLRSIFDRLSALLLRTPEDRRQLLDLLRDAQLRRILDADALAMMEGVLTVADLRACDIMVPRARMDVIDMAQPVDALVPIAIRTGHSRFPVVEGDLDRVIGTLHAKDMLRLVAEPGTSLAALLRPAVFIPETKPLNDLLRDFRENRNHLAIVVDEYGGVSGLVTIEDVLEQIVGDIEDEFDEVEVADHVTEDASGEHGPRWCVQAGIEVGAFNERFGTRFDEDEVDTIGGLVTHEFGRVPKAGETIDIGGLRFEVKEADARQVHALLVERLPAPAAATDTDGHADS